MTPARRLRLLFLVEGTTDIRFVSGLSEIADLTLAVPADAFHASGLDRRIADADLRVTIDTIPGGRLAFQWRSLAYLWRRMRSFDVVIAQEVLRGALNATLVGGWHGTPVLTYLAISPLEYFRCRRERGEIGAGRAWVGAATIGLLMRLTGALATRWLALGSYLDGLARGYAARVDLVRYYGVDTAFYTPSSEDRGAIRRRLGLPERAFIVYFPSRVSHEKDPETVIRAALLARQDGLDVAVLNTSGGYERFGALAQRAGAPADAPWIIARPAAHPTTELADYYRAADVVACASLAEGLGLAPLEALACGTPVVATAVGGLATHPPDILSLTPRQDAPAMARAFRLIADHPGEARAQALRGRAYVERMWGRERAFAELAEILRDVVARGR